MNMQKVYHLQQQGGLCKDALSFFFFFCITEINSLYTSLRSVCWILSQGHTQEIVTKTGS